MSVQSRVNWLAQQRVDLHHLLMQESFTAFDFRSIVTGLVGADKAYVSRGFKVVARSGLSLQISVANSLVYNPKDSNGSFYVGLPDDPNVTISLPSSQSNVYVEAKFRNASQAPVNTSFWDPLALTGEDASGTEFSAATDTQSVIFIEISVNTIGFSEGAIPLIFASTNASGIIAMEDRIEYMWRLAKGGATPDPTHKYEWSTSRTEPTPSGTGVGDAIDSPWRSRDATGALNDKAFGSLKEWADAVMTRISEISGSAIWYASGLATAPVGNISVNQTFFDTLGHTIQPSAQSSFIWKRSGGTLRLAGEGTAPISNGTHHAVGLVKWKSTYGKLDWHLGGAFSDATHRNYALGSIRFESDAPDDGGNVYLKLEREVPKGSGALVDWGSAGGAGSFDPNKSVSGQAGDFEGIALGDYIRKESEGYSGYYKVTGMFNGVSFYQNNPLQENLIADALVTALELELQNPLDTLTVSSEPLRYFRSRYSNDDLYADQNIATNGYLYQDADFYWLGHRTGSLFILRGYGTMQENEEVTTLNDSGATSSGDGGLVLEHGKESIHDGTGYCLKTGVAGPANPILTIRRRKRDNTVGTPTDIDNSNALLTYTIEATVATMTAGQQLWVRLSDTTGGALASGVVTNSTDDLDNTDTTSNRYEIRPAGTTPLHVRDNQDVFLLARAVTVAGQTALIFMDGTNLGVYGRLINENVEITGETKLTPRTQQGILFISETIPGQVDDEAAQLFYTKSTGTVGMRTFRVTDQNILLSAAAVTAAQDVNFLTNIGNATINVGSALSTTYIPGDLIVAGNHVAAQVSQIQSEDKLITLGVGNLVNEGYDAGIEVADNTINGTLFASTAASPDVVITLASAPGYVLGDIVGVSATTGIGGITAGQIGGQYTIVAALASPGDSTISGSTLTVRTAANAASTVSSGTTPPRAFKAEWSFKVSGSDGSLTGYTSWAFKVKNQTTKPTLTPVASYGIVPTAHSVNMQSMRIPFVNDDNAGPAGADTTLNFTGNLTWNNGTNTLTVVGNQSITGHITPGTDDTYDLGSSLLQWRFLYLGPDADSGLIFGGDTNLYRSAANHLKTDDELETATNLFVGGFADMTQQGVIPAVPSASHTRIWADDDGLVYQRTPDGDQKLLTNIQGNVYEEHVDVVSVPSGNNQMAAVPTPPTIVTLPKDTQKHIGLTLVANVTNTFATVVVTKVNHGLITGELVTVATSTAIGGISAVNLSGTFACTVLTPDTFQYTAAAVATSTATGSLNIVTAVSIRSYLVGSQDLKLYLNGQFLRLGIDWTENGLPGTLSNLVTIQQTLDVGDTLTYRIDGNGGQHVINFSAGTSLQGAYAGGSTISITPGFPVTISGASGKLLVVNGDVDITGVIDPAGITFTPQAVDPLAPSDHGFWVDNTVDKNLMFNRGAAPAVNITNDYVRRDGTLAALAATNFGNFKGINVANGTNPADAVNYGQLTAAIDLLDGYLLLDGTNSPTATMNWNSFRLSNLGTPTGPTDATTKDYVDSLFQNRNTKDPVRAATTIVLPASTYNNGLGTITGSVNGPLPLQDGVTLVINDRFLVKNQASAFQNGIYYLSQVGDGSTPFILTRTLDANTANKLDAAWVNVKEGIVSADLSYIQVSDAINLGVTNLIWSLSAALGLSGNDMITISGGLISVDLAVNAGLVSTNPGSVSGQLQINTDELTIERNANFLRVKASGITANELAADSVTALKINADVAGLGMAQASNGSLQTRTVLVPFLNDSGSLIPAGTVVGISNPTGGLRKAQANSTANSVATVGVAFEAIPDGQTGLVAVEGLCTVVGTALTVGSPAYLSTLVSGDATPTLPANTIGNTSVHLGIATSTTQIVLQVRYMFEFQA